MLKIILIITIPQTAGIPPKDDEETVHQLNGITTPVYFLSKKRVTKATIPIIAFINKFLKGFFVLIKKTKKIIKYKIKKNIDI